MCVCGGPQGVSGLSDQPSAGADGGVEESRQHSGQRPRQRYTDRHTLKDDTMLILKLAVYFVSMAIFSRHSSEYICSRVVDALSLRVCVFTHLSAEYKKARQEIKKRSSDTLKLQKKAKKGVLCDTKSSS